MSSISPQIGKGFFQDFQKKVWNRLSGRKTITQKLLKPLKDSTKQTIQNQLQKNTQRRTTLKQKKQRTQRELQELKVLDKTIPALQTVLKAKIAPTQDEYERQRKELLNQRPLKQKAYNKYYNEDPSQIEENVANPTSVEGIVSFKKDTRNPLSKEGLELPNANIPEPPSQASSHRIVNGEEISLAGQATVTYINAPLYYAQWKQEPPLARLEEISDDDYNEFREALSDPRDARAIFHIPDDVSEDDWFLDMEEGAGFESGESYKIVDFVHVFEDGTKVEKKLIKIGASRSIERLFSDLNTSKDDLIKNMELDLAQCLETQAADDTRDHYSPLTTLKSNGCIWIFPNIERTTLLTMGGYKNFLIIPPPFNTKTTAFMAKYMKGMRMVQDALDNWAIEGMDPLFWKLIETKYPDISIRISTYIFTTFENKVPLYLNQLNYTENFMMVDTSIDFGTNTQDVMDLTVKNPFAADSKYVKPLRKAIERKKLYGVTPYVAYFMKKTVPSLWKEAFESSQVNYSTYETLNAHEKIAIDYLQYLRFMETLVDTGYNYVEARTSYEDSLGDGSPTEGVMNEVIELYKEDVPKHAKEISFFQSLVTRQLAEDENHAVITSPADITALLLKFTGPAIGFAPRRNRFSALAEAVSEERAARPPLTLRSPAPARNLVTQLQSRLAVLKNERTMLLQNSPAYNAASKTRRNRNEVNRMYKNMMGRLGTFSRFTKSKERKNLQLKRNVAKATFNRLDVLNRNIQDLEQRVAAELH